MHPYTLVPMDCAWKRQAQPCFKNHSPYNENHYEHHRTPSMLNHSPSSAPLIALAMHFVNAIEPHRRPTKSASHRVERIHAPTRWQEAAVPFAWRSSVTKERGPALNVTQMRRVFPAISRLSAASKCLCNPTTEKARTHRWCNLPWATMEVSIASNFPWPPAARGPPVVTLYHARATQSSCKLIQVEEKMRGLEVAIEGLRFSLPTSFPNWREKVLDLACSGAEVVIKALDASHGVPREA